MMNVMKQPWHTSVRRCGAALRAGALALGGALLMSHAAHANFTNGGFESGLTGWTVQSHFNENDGLLAVPPTSVAQLNLTANSANNGLTIATSGADSNTGGALVVPRSGFGAQAARVNGPVEYYNASSISQTATMVAGDVAPDGNIHMRFALAPVLQNPRHKDVEQPYFYVELTNVTKGTKLFTQFNFANQPGVNWQTYGGGDIQFTDWVTYDIPLASSLVAVGDELKLEVFAAGCSQSGHWGYVYVDQVSTAALPGLSVAATGPASIVLAPAAPYSTITYTYTYNNNSTDPAANSTVTAVLPVTGNNVPTTFNAFNVPAGVTCTAPAVNSTGTVACNFGTLAPGATGSFTITVNVPPTASVDSPTNVVNHGNYNIQATSVSPLTGPLVVTNVYATGFVLDLTKTGSGQGSVASLPAGINCGTSCTSGSTVTAPGAQVTLTASAAAGSVFTGWSGGGCSGNALTCVVTMSEARSVIANFESAVVAATPVPTLSQWGVLIMAVLLGLLALGRLPLLSSRRR